MRKNRKVLTLFVLILTVMAVMASGCITILDKQTSDGASDQSVPLSGDQNPAAPVVKSFTADNTSVNAGQQVMLSWEVEGSQKVEIDPIVGAVSASSAAIVSPTTTTTYTLTATNAAGTTVDSITVTVGGTTVADRPDLVVTNIDLVSGIVYYTVKNVGTAASKACRAQLSIDNLKKADAYIEVLAPGEERKSSFSNYTFNYVFNEHFQGQFTDALQQYAVKVCVDVENVVVENDESDNCKTVIWGQKFTYNFVDFYNLAHWTTGYGVLTLPLPEENAAGSARVEYKTLEDNLGYGQSLLTVPQQVDNGWIQGEFGDFYTDEMRYTRVREIEMPRMGMFSARVGFTNTTPQGSQAKFTFGTVDQSGRVTYAPSITATMDGTLQDYYIDLSALAEQKCMFVLKVEVIGPAVNVRPVWVSPRISQP